MLQSLYSTPSKFILLFGVLGLSASLSTINEAKAAGFYIQEQSVKGLGTAFAGSVTSLDDASTIYFNPAGMTDLDGAQANAGVHLLLPSADLDDTGSSFAVPGTALEDNGNPFDPSPVPNLFYATPVDLGGQKFWAGVGVTAPFGLGNDYGNNSFTQFDSTESDLLTINIAPSLAYQISERISVGGGVDIQYADADLRSSVFVGAGAIGESQLTGDDISVGYNLGVKVKATPKTEVGLHYRSAINHELEGEINISGTGTPADSSTNGGADLNLPDIATLGVAHNINNRTRVMGQATWFGWNNFQEIRAVDNAGNEISNVVQGYQNTYALAIGGEYDLNPQLTLRAGYQFDETPTTDEFRTSRTPDGDRHWFSGGATYKLNHKIDLDFATTYIDVGEETINVTRNGGAATVSADTDGYVGIVAGAINYTF